jgi:hypothetical protein
MKTRNRMGWAMKRCFVAGLLMMLVAVFAGCGSQKEGAGSEADLGSLAQEYWTKRLVDKDYQSIYDLELEKGSIPFDDYVTQVKRSERFTVSTVKTQEVRIDGDRAEVFLTVRCNLPMVPKEVGMTLQDLWVLQSDQWKHKFLPVK